MNWEECYNRYIGLVKYCSKTLGWTNDPVKSYEDLVSEGVCALWKSYNRVQEGDIEDKSNYIKTCIRNAIISELVRKRGNNAQVEYAEEIHYQEGSNMYFFDTKTFNINNGLCCNLDDEQKTILNYWINPLPENMLKKVNDKIKMRRVNTVRVVANSIMYNIFSEELNTSVSNFKKVLRRAQSKVLLEAINKYELSNSIEEFGYGVVLLKMKGLNIQQIQEYCVSSASQSGELLSTDSVLDKIKQVLYTVVTKLVDDVPMGVLSVLN